MSKKKDHEPTDYIPGEISRSHFDCWYCGRRLSSSNGGWSYCTYCGMSRGEDSSEMRYMSEEMQQWLIDTKYKMSETALSKTLDDLAKMKHAIERKKQRRKEQNQPKRMEFHQLYKGNKSIK